MTAQLFGFALTAILMFAFYGYALPRLGSLATLVVNRTRLGYAIGTDDADKVGRLMLAAFSQSLFLLLLARVRNVRLALPGFDLTLLLLVACGVILGAAEMAAGGWLAQIAMSTLIAVEGDRGPSSTAWLASARGGWMREYRKAIEHLPGLLALIVISVYVGGEELIFRGVVAAAARGGGPAWAVVSSTLLFAGVQGFSTTSWRNALFPFCGATVMGIIHGALYLSVPTVVPLVVAHIFFFVLAMTYET